MADLTDDTITLTFDRDITGIGAYQVKYSETGAFSGEEITFTATTDYTVADGAENTVIITLTGRP